MKILLSKECLSKYELKEIIKNVHQLFDEYNSKKILVKFYREEVLSAHINKEFVHNKKVSNPVLTATLKREPLIIEIQNFNTKLRTLKANFTEEEKKIFKYCIEERKTECELCDLLHSSVKTVRWIKKSCYVKTALRFGLIE
ncbi:MAG: hypothetical protein HFH08_06365 [Bacilli bacterium]|nr:hypothetical protein [Bacilli bacterium]